LLPVNVSRETLVPRQVLNFKFKHELSDLQIEKTLGSKDFLTIISLKRELDKSGELISLIRRAGSPLFLKSISIK
jgi:hypothetical protein